MLKNNERNAGITLVALVITIIILLILAGISIASLTGNGLFEKAKLAKEKSENAQVEEDTRLADYENKIQEYVNNSNREQSSYLKDSSLIKGLDFIDINKTPHSIEIQINVTETNQGDAVIYYVFCNGKVVNGGTSNIIKIENLERNTTYIIKCAVIDVDGNIKISEEKSIGTNNSFILYDNGQLNSEITGKWTSSGNQNQKITLNSDNIYFYNTATGSYSNKIFWLSNNLDLSQYSKFIVEWKVVSKKMSVFGITTSTPVFNNDIKDETGVSQFAKYNIGEVTSDVNKQEVDISDLDNGYIAFYLFDVKAYIYRMYLY